jgi:2-hydroxychromene-2-carboxylate isomerase
VRAVFYFDLGSPYAYLAAERLGRRFPEPPLWQPILLGGLFKRFGTSSWALGAERPPNVAEIERRARAYGLPPLVWPLPFPGNTLFAMRAATRALEAGVVETFARAAFREAFASGRDLTLPDTVLRAAAACGLAAKDVRVGAESPRVKDALVAATARAGDLGVRGVPSVAVGSIIYFGDDHFEEAVTAAKRHGGEGS